MLKILKNILKIIYSFLRQQISKIKILLLLRDRSEFFLEIGAGNKNGVDNWLTIDMTKNCDIFWDLRNGIPFPDQSIDKIYSSHFFEHLTFKEGQKNLDECLRVLKPGAIFSICVPNARLFVDAYLNSKNKSNELIQHLPAFNNTTKIDFLNYNAYMDGEHKYMFDEENLVFILRSKGLKNVRLRQFDSSIDLQVRDFESIYAIAEK